MLQLHRCNESVFPCLGMPQWDLDGLGKSQPHPPISYTPGVFRLIRGQETYLTSEDKCGHSTEYQSCCCQTICKCQNQKETVTHGIRGMRLYRDSQGLATKCMRMRRSPYARTFKASFSKMPMCSLASGLLAESPLYICACAFRSEKTVHCKQMCDYVVTFLKIISK